MARAEIPTAGETIGGKYRVLGEIATGGMGVVVRATHLHLRETVAIKILRPEISLRPESVARFMREARLTMKLRGDHVVRVFDVDVLEGRLPYLVMEHLEGEDLALRIAREGALPPALVIDWLLQACEGVLEAHALGIVHRDLKPANLFLTPRPDGGTSVKVLDFGVSKASSILAEKDHVTESTSEPKLPVAAPAEGAVDLTSTRTVLGSPRYMSPEQLESPKSVDARTDIWALGAIAYEMLSGEPPFPGDEIEELREAITEGTPKPLDAPPGLRAVVERCLAKDPDRRYPNVGALAAALRALRPRRSRFAIAIPILGVTGAIAIAIVLAQKPERTPAPALPVASTASHVELQESAPAPPPPSVASSPLPSSAPGPIRTASRASIALTAVSASAPSASTAAPALVAPDAGKPPGAHLFDNPE